MGFFLLSFPLCTIALSFSVSTGADTKKMKLKMKLEMKLETEGGDESAETVKKVKKKDPITFDLFAALSATKKQEKKMTVLATKKPVTTPTPVRNILDSGAPSKRRGKERERPKKKKKTPLKRQILETREKRKKVCRYFFQISSPKEY